MKTLKKKNKIITGVCGGIADALSIDPTIVRILVCILVFFTKGIGFILYIVAAIVMPEDDGKNFTEDNIDNLKSANMDSSDFKEDKTSKTDSEVKKNVPHTNEEFNEFFKK